MKKVVLALVVVLFALQGQAQMKKRVADRLYNELAFFKAVELYQDLAKKKNADSYVIRRTADCYRLIDDSKNAELWYAKLAGTQGAIANDFYNYAQVLKSNEKYKEANVQMETFYTKASGNSIANAHHGNENYADELKIDAARYEIELLKGVNTEDSDFGSNYYTLDGKKSLIFSSNRRNMGVMNKEFQWDGSHFLDVYTVAIGSDGQAEGKPESFTKDVRSKYHEGPVAFSNKGTKMYLTRSNYLSKKKGLDKKRHNNLKLYTSEFANGKWSELVEFPFNDDNYSVGHATVTEDGNTMYFVSDMPKPRGGKANANKGETDIWKSVKLPNGKWDLPQNVKSVNTEGREMFPHIAESGILYFASNGHVGLGGLDLYRSEPQGEGFGTPLNMGYPLNTNADDFGFIPNDDETMGYFSSNRETDLSIGDDDIYKANILYPFGDPVFSLKVSVVDDKTGEKLPMTTVKVVNIETGEIIKEVVTGEDGTVEVSDIPEGKYKVVGEKDNFDMVSPFEFNTDDFKNNSTINGDVRMKKNDCGLIGKITDAEENTPIEGVKVIVKNNTTGETVEYISNSEGNFKDGLNGIPCPGGMIDYDILFEKEGYFPKTIGFKYKIVKAGIVDLNQFMEGIKLQKEAGEVTEYCNIGDILFDFNKSRIRPDAAAELDKLVACMNENPKMRIEIGSHTDCRGKDRYNLKLSDKRAKSSMRYVISQGISKNRIFGKGYGETVLKAGKGKTCYKCTEEEHQINRRTEFQIVGADGKKIK